LQTRSSVSVASGTMKPGNCQVNYAGRTSSAKGRGEKQNNILIMPVGNSRAGLFIIADGNDLACTMALKTIGSHADKTPSPDAGVLAKAMRKANEEIYRYAQDEGEASSCTVTASLLQENKLTIAHAGDTRVYIINRNKIRQITKDHTIAEKSQKDKFSNQETEEAYPKRQAVYRMIGANPHIEFALYDERISQKDIILICNYGLWMYISEEELHKTATGAGNLNGITDKLINMANQKGSEEDINIIIFQIN
jgi:PPM family protein phosphatase